MMYHPITGAPAHPKDRDLTDRGVLGEVTSAVYDHNGTLILSYADGHLWTVDFDLTTREILVKTYHPKVLA